jgi:hypothetical protein
MKTILISTIIRDRANYINTWYNQLKKIVELDANNKYYLSVYENDSKDESKDLLNQLDFSFFQNHKIQSETLNTVKYPSIINKERVELLAEARNKSLYNNDFLNKCSHVLSLESDITYEPQVIIDKIINFGEYDIISPRSTALGTELYDEWATREKDSDLRWHTPTQGVPRNLKQVWSTFNCLCLYNAEPIKQRITFGGHNDRLNSFDCDTVVICENFRKNGFSKIILNGEVEILHE